MKMESSNDQVLSNYMREFTPARLRAIRRSLGDWYKAAKRDLPWRHTRDPYRIWISEIMLQQTRVAAVIPYYERFLSSFPDPASLAAASDDDLLRAWSGLGYYSRARNLRAAARKIVELGAFPHSHDQILALPGIGPYTAAAVASICFDSPYAVLDGNVMRVLARLTHEDGDIQATATRRRLQATAQNLLDIANPAEHNQAVMELGAVICVPRDPKCKLCPVSGNCLAHSAGVARELPKKTRRAEVRRVRRTLLVAIRNGNILLWQRAQDASMLGGFYELPEPHQLPGVKVGKILYEFSHAITNHIYDFHVMAVRVSQVSAILQWTPLDQLSALPLSTVARKAMAGFPVPYDTHHE
jgi:A/G-specific adenine glycosylase